MLDPQLRAHSDEMRDVTLRELFTAESDRGDRLHLEAAGWYLDYSKQRVRDRLQLADVVGQRTTKPHLRTRFTQHFS